MGNDRAISGRGFGGVIGSDVVRVVEPRRTQNERRSADIPSCRKSGELSIRRAYERLIERYFGVPLAIQVEQMIEYERRRVVWRA